VVRTQSRVTSGRCMLACLSGSGIVYTHPSEKTTIAAPPGYLISALGFPC